MHSQRAVFAIKQIADKLAFPVYRLRGSPPWAPGYYTNKKVAIELAISSRAVQVGRPLPDTYGFGLDERIVEFPWLFEQLRRLPKGIGALLDAGSTLNHDFILRHEPIRSADLTMMTLAPEKQCYWYNGFSYVYGDFRDSKFRDGAFDTIVSISTLEHVGLDNTMLYTTDAAKAETIKNGFVDAVREFRRIISPGGHCLITVPYGRYEDFKWFHVFDRGMLQALIDAFSPSSLEVEFFKYESDAWRRSSQSETDSATAYDPHSGRGREEDKAGCARGLACIKLVR